MTDSASIAAALAWVVTGVRAVVGAAFVLAALVALTHWAVRSGKLAPFGGWARFVRSWSDSLLRPVELRINRAGGNPQDAPLWLLGIVVLGGLLLIGLLEWVFGFVVSLVYAAKAGPSAILPTLVNVLFTVLMTALLIRVIASWFGISPYSRLMRIVHGLSDWLVDPIRRFVPAFGPFDLSPMIAWLVLSLTRSLIMRAYF